MAQVKRKLRPLWCFKIEEINGEQRYEYIEYLYASNFTEAMKIAREWTRELYYGSRETSHNIWASGKIEWYLECIFQCDVISILPINGDRIELDIRPSIDLTVVRC